MEKNEQIDVLKKTLAETVERKRENTRARVAYRKATPVSDERSNTLRGYWRTNGDLKDEIRSLGLAYAFLRGRRYWTTERTVVNPARASGVAAALGDTSIMKEVIEAWIAEKPSDEERLAFEAHLAAANEKARIERQARSAAKRAA